MFTHLHNHTEHSCLDGYGHLSALVDEASERGFKSLAITDHGTTSGHMHFGDLCQKKNIKPIFGCEVYVVDDHLERTNQPRRHALLLVKNETGYKNLMKIVSESFLSGFYYRARISEKFLLEHNEGLVCSSACTSGIINKHLLEDNHAKALESAKEYKDVFGDDFYIEIMPHDFDDQKIVNEKILELHRSTGIPLIATNDLHYPKPEDAWIHDVLLCIQTKSKIYDTDRLKFSCDGFHLRTEEEMIKAFKNTSPFLRQKELEQAIANTGEISDKCNYTIAKNLDLLPEIVPVEKEEEFIKALLRKGWSDRRIPERAKRLGFTAQKYKDRLNKEWGTIKRLNFLRYFLIVHDLIDWAKKNGIACGFARGSVAASLISYLLHITEIDPVQHDLLFERFISSKRIDLPDIDMDFEDQRRDEVKEYLKGKYGEHSVSSIRTYSKLTGKAVLKDVSRAFGVPYEEVNEMTPYIITRSGGDARASFTLIDSVESFGEFQKFATKYPKVIEASAKLEGQLRQKGIHAAGVVICKHDLRNHLSLEVAKGKSVTSLDDDGCESLGLLKLDILGLKTLTMLKQVCQDIKKFKGETIDLREIPYDEQAVFDEFSKGENTGVFQFESKGMRKMCYRIGVKDFNELIVLNALHRPGAIRSGIMTKYERIKKDLEKPEYEHEIIEKYTKETLGVIIYQEQVMFLMHELAGFDWSHADIIRKIISKSGGVEMFARQREDFINGAKEKVDISLANRLFNKICQFGSFAFNKAHACAYSHLAYQCMWLKIHYPLELVCGLLNFAPDKERFIRAIREAQKLEINLKRIDVNRSSFNHKIEGSSIRVGFKDISGISIKASTKIEETQPYAGFEDFLKKVDRRTVNKRVVKNLVLGQGFEDQIKNPAHLLENFEKALGKTKKAVEIIQESKQGKIDTKERMKQIAQVMSIPFKKAMMSKQELDELNEILKHHKIVNIVDSESRTSGQSFFILAALTELNYGWRKNVSSTIDKKTISAGVKENLGSLYGNLEDETDFLLGRFSDDCYSRQGSFMEKEIVGVRCVYYVVTTKMQGAVEVVAFYPLSAEIREGFDFEMEEHVFKSTGKRKAYLDKEKLLIQGYMLSVNRFRSKKGMMAKISINILSENIEVLVFAEEFQKIKSLLIPFRGAKIKLGNWKGNYFVKKIIETFS